MTFIFNVVFYFLDYQYNDKISAHVNANSNLDHNCHSSDSFGDGNADEIKASVLDRNNYDA